MVIMPMSGDNHSNSFAVIYIYALQIIGNRIRCVHVGATGATIASSVNQEGMITVPIQNRIADAYVDHVDLEDVNGEASPL